MSKPKPDTTGYRYTGGHTGDDADGRLLEPGQTYKLDADQVEKPHNAALIADGLLVAIAEEEKS